MIETVEVIHTKEVNGFSKLKLFAFLYFALDIKSLMPYESTEVKTIKIRIAKIQTMSNACNSTD